jgi:hypothetical protein
LATLVSPAPFFLAVERLQHLCSCLVPEEDAAYLDKQLSAGIDQAQQFNDSTDMSFLFRVCERCLSTAATQDRRNRPAPVAGSLSIFWSNWLVGGIVSLALFMVAWLVISWALEHAKLKREHEVVELD